MTDSFPNPTGPVIDAFAPVRRVALWFGGGVGVLCSVWIMGLHLTGNNAFGPKQLLAELLVPFVALTSQWVLRRRLLQA